MLEKVIDAAGLMLMLLNPFLLIVYLIDVVQSIKMKMFLNILIRAGIISSVVFIIFALGSEFIFNKIMHARFESMQMFGGVILLMIAIHFVFKGNSAIEGLRGKPQYVAGAIAMPIMVGPGTVSISVLIGGDLPACYSCITIISAVFFCILIMILLKLLHDYIRPRREQLVERYIDIIGRITSLIVGTYAVDMFMRGLKAWLDF